MSPISQNYPSPVTVNGFSCRNCTEVDYAKRYIDPVKPEAGPYGMNDPERDKAASARLVKRMDELAADRASVLSYSANGTPVASNAIGTTVDRFG